MRHISFLSPLLILLIVLLGFGCSQQEPCPPPAEDPFYVYHDWSDPELNYSGGVKMIPIQTPKGEFKVWTKRVGNNPTIKVLLLHGGPGLTHEIYASFDAFFPKAGIEYIYYDQLGSYYSDQPDDLSLWELDRFVEEVEQVRVALGLDKDNFYLLGQSWGGILGMQYALKYQDNMKALIISNMVPSLPEYTAYSENVLAPMMPEEVQKEVNAIEDAGDYDNPRYLQLLMEHYYTEHILRRLLEEWPEPVNRCFEHINPEVYVTMQGPSEFGIKGDANLKEWDVKDRLKELKVPTLSIGAKYDTMDPEQMEWIANEVQNGQFLFCPNGSHLAQYDDQKIYFEGLIKFIREVDAGTFSNQ